MDFRLVRAYEEAGGREQKTSLRPRVCELEPLDF